MLRSTKFFVISSSLVSIAILAGTLGLTQSYSAFASSVGGSAGLTGIDVNSMDKSATPVGDFFQYANGTWLKNTPIPNAYDKWGVLNIIHDKNLELVRGILEKAANDTNAASGSNQKKIGDFYFIGMDEEKANKADMMPIADELKRIDDMKNLDDLRVEVGRLHEQGVNVMFGFSSGQDFKDSTKVIGQAGQAGLGLPDRDYYTNDDEHSKKLREQYVEHVGKMLKLLGLDESGSINGAKKIMDLETALAKGSMKNTDLRDPDKVYHKMTVAQLDELTPKFSWSKYLQELGSDCKDINVGQPDFFKTLEQQLSEVSLADWKTYLKWHLVDMASPYLSSRFVDQDFSFVKILTGKKENLPRWKRVVAASDRAMGEAVGQAYVDVTFTPDAKEKALNLVKKIKEVLRDDLSQLDWMSKDTRSNAISKLDALGLKIGYPDKWRDYGSLKIDRDSYWNNVANAEKFEFHRQLEKIGKPVDKTEWLMTPQTVNAYYWAEQNEIVFPAGILQPPIFDPKADDATNLGAMGMIIGHELTHGFDDQGSKFDGNGNLKNWWSADDEQRFKERVALIEKQYEGYTVNGDVHLKGKLVAGEAAADLGGLTIAFKTLEKILGDKPREKDKNGFTPEQRFFISFAQAWATNVRPEKERLMAATDPHPTPRLRVNGTLANMDAFEQTFPTTGSQPVMMLPTRERCRLW